MANEEMQSTMQFIVEHQAQFSVSMQRLEENVEKLGDSALKINETVEKLGEKVDSLRRFVGQIAVAQAATETNLARTDERLNNLITIVERYISEHRNGSS